MEIDWDDPAVIERGKKIIQEMMEKEERVKAFFETPEFFVILNRIKNELKDGWLTEDQLLYGENNFISYNEFILFCESISKNVSWFQTMIYLFEETFWLYKGIQLSLCVGQGSYWSVKLADEETAKLISNSIII
jgi:hypothetical protein